jgi:SAM-dependent methyltransferase
MKLYEELADWWPLFSEPSHYALEADFIRRVLDDFSDSSPRNVLELGSGGGNNASHLSAHYSLTLVDASPKMLAVSRRLNRNCEHREGDMRTVRLGRTFDAVLIHDAICYMTCEVDLRGAMRTAFEHCKVGGVAVFMPDFVRETFVADTKHGGYDSGARGLRYLDWTYDPDPADTTYLVDLVIAIREASGDVRVVHDRHIEGLFARSDWIGLLREVGFDPKVIVDPWHRDVFVGTRKLEQ